MKKSIEQESFVRNKQLIYTGQISLRLFNIFGMWQPLFWNSSWKIWLYTIYSYMMIVFYFSFTITFLVYLFYVSDDINIFTECLFHYLYSVAILIKQINIIAKRKIIIESKNCLLSSLCQPRDFYEQEVLQKCSHDCRWKVMLFFLLCNITGASILLSPLLKRSKITLPVRGWYPYSLDSKFMFCITYVYQVVAVVMSTCITTSVDGLALTLMLQISAQFKICVHRIQFLPTMCKSISDSEFNLHEQESKLVKDCIKHHEHLYLFGKRINDLFGWVIFVHLLTSVMSLCVIIYQLSKLNSRNPSFWVMISTVSTILAQTFLYCYYGEIIIEKSTAVADSIYKINWINLKNRTKHDLIIMMSKAAKPIQLSGASIIVMSLRTFITILKSAYSAYNLLANI